MSELIDTLIGLAQNGSQSPSVYLPMVRHDRLSKGRFTAQDDMAAVLSSH